RHCSPTRSESACRTPRQEPLMQTRTRRSVLLGFASAAIGTGVVLGFAGWPRPHATLEFSGLILAAILASIPASRHSKIRDWAVMPACFVIDFTSLLLLGPHATLLVAAAGTVTQGLTASQHPHPIRRTLLDTAIALVAIEAAGFAHRALGGTMGGFTWPGQGVPIAAAIAVYCFATSAVADIIAPFCTRQPVNRSWLTRLLRGCPNYCIGASVAVGLVEAIGHRNWQVLVVAVVPLGLAFRAYHASVNRLEQELIESLDEGLSVVDGSGRITFWNDALERILECPRERALGCSFAGAVPLLAKTELPRAINDALNTRTAQTLANVALPAAAGPRILQVKVLPVVGGATVLWHDVTEHARTELALRRSAERLSLAADGANDGLWEWDLRSQEFYFSSRWKAMIGLPASAGVGRPQDWIDRVHPDDVVALKAALEAHLGGKTEQVHIEHRIRHEDGAYRRYLCCGVAVRGAGRRMARMAGSLTEKSGPIATDAPGSVGLPESVTDACNRAVFVERLGRRLAATKERPDTSKFAALCLDLDRFKIVNDSLGHQVGDELLEAVSHRLASCLREGDALGRLGGDEFAILLHDLGDEGQANATAFRIQDALKAPFSIGGREVFTTASIGIAFGRSHYSSPDEMMRDADTAMSYAKSSGKARHELFDADMHKRE